MTNKAWYIFASTHLKKERNNNENILSLGSPSRLISIVHSSRLSWPRTWTFWVYTLLGSLISDDFSVYWDLLSSEKFSPISLIGSASESMLVLLDEAWSGPMSLSWALANGFPLIYRWAMPSADRSLELRRSFPILIIIYCISARCAKGSTTLGCCCVDYEDSVAELLLKLNWKDWLD